MQGWRKNRRRKKSTRTAEEQRRLINSTRESGSEQREPQKEKGESHYNNPIQIRGNLGEDTYRMRDGQVWHRNRLVKYVSEPGTGTDREEMVIEPLQQPQQTVFIGDDTFVEAEDERSDGEDEVSYPVETESENEDFGTPPRERGPTTEDADPEEPSFDSTPSRAQETNLEATPALRPVRIRRRPDRFADCAPH